MNERLAGETAPEHQRFIEIYQSTVAALYRYVAVRTNRQRCLAEDITQETYARAVDAWAKRGIPREPIAWLKHVAANIVRDHYRRLQPANITALELETWLEQPASENDDLAEVI